MTNLKRLPILIIILLIAGVFFAGSVKKEIDPPGKYEKILHNVTDMLKEAHYSPKLIDDSFSKFWGSAIFCSMSSNERNSTLIILPSFSANIFCLFGNMP